MKTMDSNLCYLAPNHWEWYCNSLSQHITWSVASRWSTQSWIMNWIQLAASKLNCNPVSVNFSRTRRLEATNVGWGSRIYLFHKKPFNLIFNDYHHFPLESFKFIILLCKASGKNSFQIPTKPCKLATNHLKVINKIYLTSSVIRRHITSKERVDLRVLQICCLWHIQ